MTPAPTTTNATPPAVAPDAPPDFTLEVAETPEGTTGHRLYSDQPEAFMRSLGLRTQDEIAPFITNLASLCGLRSDSPVATVRRVLGGAVRQVQGMEPRDPIEATLIAQMVAINTAMALTGHRLTCATNTPQQDSAVSALNKLARTFTTQMEALNRNRGKGQQVVRVERVLVNDGGQAIVGAVQGAGEPGR